MPVIVGGYRLVRTDTNEDVELGQHIKDFRGEDYVLNSATAPREGNGLVGGRVYVTRHDKPFRSEYFPSVFNLRYIKEPQS